ncbi:hypothetical protein J2Z60_002145 [Lactobacillus colini]|uniref:Uncharacterized protein n=1 Tax=Lactobacillus colini TaxID=1819254 RepID=A0ABS4MHX8_9LACO|nr:hypothetical protein [Lactobacillus colini]MBP2058954.1 hypothetical protein [Lactobacillus colini]
MELIQALDILSENRDKLAACSSFLSGLALIAEDSYTKPEGIIFLSNELFKIANSFNEVLPVIEKLSELDKNDDNKGLKGVDIASYLDKKMEQFEELSQDALSENTIIKTDGQVEPVSFIWRELAQLANQIAIAEDYQKDKED